jgi:hypothetical protein
MAKKRRDMLAHNVWRVIIYKAILREGERGGEREREREGERGREEGRERGRAEPFY